MRIYTNQILFYEIQKERITILDLAIVLILWSILYFMFSSLYTDEKSYVSYESFVNMQRIVVLQTRSGTSFAKEGESIGIAYDPIELRGPDFGKQQAQTSRYILFKDEHMIALDSRNHQYTTVEVQEKAPKLIG